MLLQSTPTALAQIMQGLTAAMEVEAPGASAANQWATCAPLAGQSIITTPSGAALGPYFPEFCAWGLNVAQRTDHSCESLGITRVQHLQQESLSYRTPQRVEHRGGRAAKRMK